MMWEQIFIVAIILPVALNCLVSLALYSVLLCRQLITSLSTNLEGGLVKTLAARSWECLAIQAV